MATTFWEFILLTRNDFSWILQSTCRYEIVLDITKRSFSHTLSERNRERIQVL